MKFCGYSEIKEMEKGYFQCDKCNYQFSWCARENGNNVCPECKNIFNVFKIVPKKVDGGICKNCDEELIFTEENLCSENIYLCPKCQNIVNIFYNDENNNPEHVLSTNFNKNNIKNGIKISDDLLLVMVDNEKSKCVLDLLNIIVKGEKTGFNSFHEETQKAMLIYNDSEAMGYIS
ncbi:hypothetical protein [Methanobrevibacter sp. DSM 116169]|uniref:hypothetical protein n=1 Tax=Methanobrevibacter sp. DSM 116169 TaxID=3242727 RepID=UPI0038FCBD18